MPHGVAANPANLLPRPPPTPLQSMATCWQSPFLRHHQKAKKRIASDFLLPPLLSLSPSLSLSLSLFLFIFSCGYFPLYLPLLLSLTLYLSISTFLITPSLPPSLSFLPFIFPFASLPHSSIFR